MSTAAEFCLAPELQHSTFISIIVTILFLADITKMTTVITMIIITNAPTP